MKALNFNRDSWHYKVATEWGGMPKWFEDTNICEYSRAVMKGIAGLLLLTAAAFGLLYWVADTIAWWIAMLVTGVFIEEPGPIVLTGVTIIGTVSVVGGYLLTRLQWWLEDRRRNKSNNGYTQQKPDSFVKKAWRSWKDKTCVRVTLN